MRTQPTLYQAAEAATNRDVVELYSIKLPPLITTPTTDRWVYLLSATDASFSDSESHAFLSAPISRGNIIYNNTTQADELDIYIYKTAISNTYSLLQDIPVELMQVKIKKAYRTNTAGADVSGNANYENLIFVGRVRGYSVTAEILTLHCVGLKYFMKVPVPQIIYKRTCNWMLGSTYCGITLATYRKTLSDCTIDADGVTITSTSLTSHASPYFVHGFVEYGSAGHNKFTRVVTSQPAANQMIINKPFYSLTLPATGVTLYAYPGCDGNLSTCGSKFANTNHFGGFPYIPVDNVGFRI